VGEAGASEKEVIFGEDGGRRVAAPAEIALGAALRSALKRRAANAIVPSPVVCFITILLAGVLTQRARIAATPHS
jgi:hypothetical protein